MRVRSYKKGVCRLPKRTGGGLTRQKHLLEDHQDQRRRCRRVAARTTLADDAQFALQSRYEARFFLVGSGHSSLMCTLKGGQGRGTGRKTSLKSWICDASAKSFSEFGRGGVSRGTHLKRYLVHLKNPSSVQFTHPVTERHAGPTKPLSLRDNPTLLMCLTKPLLRNPAHVDARRQNTQE